MITGPTASGKGAVAFEAARRAGGEIISLDSMKVYREMDIGTAKPSPERRREVRYHLIDIVPPDRDFSTGDYLPLLEAALREVRSRGGLAVVCGGTALYLVAWLYGLDELPAADPELRRRLRETADSEGVEALHARLAQVDPEAARRILPGDLRRIVRALEIHERTGRPASASWTKRREGPPPAVPLFGIARERDELYARVDRRVLGMVEAGLFEEAGRLLERQPPPSRTALQCIGYKEIAEARATKESRAATVERIQRATRRFAKRQLTWFRKLPVRWTPPGRPEDVAARLLEERARWIREG